MSVIAALEGGLWLTWAGYQGKQLNQSYEERGRCARLSSTDPLRADKIWAANKAILLNTTTTVSAGAYLVNWAKEVELITLGQLTPLVGAFAHLGTLFTSPVKLWNTLKELSNSLEELENALSLHEKKKIGYKQFDKALGVAMLTCFIGWSALGIVHAFTGGLSLFLFSDGCFFYGLMIFLARFVSAVLLKPSDKPATP